MSFRVDIVQCRGTPFEVGRQQGRLLAETPQGRLVRRRKDALLPAWFDLAADERAYARFAPALWQEIAGIADGLGVSMARAALSFGNGGLRSLVGGCSAAITSDVYSRNYDWRPHDYGARLALVQPEGSHASVGFSELLTGRLDGMNERGLSVGLHLIWRTPVQPGLSCVAIVRMVLDQCATTEEAVDLLRRLPHAMRYNYSLLDAAGTAAVVEAAPGAVFVRRGPWLACTNHYQSPDMRPYNKTRERSSWNRLPPLEAWASRGLPAAEMFRAFNDASSPAFFHDYLRGSGTMHTLVTEPKARLALLGIGGDTAPFDLDFARWCEGNDLDAAHLAGQLGGVARPFDWPRMPMAKKAS